MATISTLAYKIVMDMRELQEGVTLSRKEMNLMKQVVEETTPPVQKLQMAEEALGKLLAKGAIDQHQHTAALGRMKQELSPAAMSVDKLQKSLELSHQQLLSQIPVVGRFASQIGSVHPVAIAASAGVELLRSSIAQLKVIDEVGDTAAKLGLATSELSQMRIAAKFADVEVTSVTTGMNKMSINVAKAAKGMEEQKKIFRGLGIDAKDLMGLGLPEMFTEISNAISAIPDNADKLLAIQQIFGKTGYELRPLIDDTQRFLELARESGAVVSNEMARRVEEADLATKQLSLAWEGLKNEIAVTTAGPLADFSRGLSQIMKDFRRMAEGRPLIEPILPQTEAESFAARGISHDPFLAGLIKQQREDQEAAETESKFIQSLREEAEVLGLTRTQLILHKAAKADLAESAMEVVRSITEEMEAHERSIKAAAEEEQLAKGREAFLNSLREEVHLLGLSRVEMEIYKAARKGLTDSEFNEAQSLIFRRDDFEEAKKAERERAQLFKQHENDAQRIVDSLKSPEELAADRLGKARELIGEGLLHEQEFEQLLGKEARGLLGPDQDRHVAAKAFGSQEAIAATLGRRDEKTNERRFEDMKKSLREIAKNTAKQPDIEVIEKI